MGDGAESRRRRLAVPEARRTDGAAWHEVEASRGPIDSGVRPDRRHEHVHHQVTNRTFGVTGFRVEVLPDKSLPKRGPGRAGNGNFVLSELKSATVDANGKRTPLNFVKAQATFEQADGKNNPYKGWKAAAAIDGDVKGSTWGWAVMPQAGKANESLPSWKTP